MKGEDKMTISEYRQAYKLHMLYDAWLPLPSVYEKCDCGRKITRRIATTITCSKCNYIVKSYNKIHNLA